ncbi:MULTISPECIES: FMN-binding protein [Bradyrhizobium]|jgi:Na+-translocating ferredoxin:NAD+ oxidoreductase RnfG subunit|uniref:FMN-binding protein n=2 Tax=Bradyrhizobium TaxID=374 RepID=A0ABS5G6V4_9BRAD|nr:MULTISPECIES: FMN-binding protein [Bradyrhizobium]MDU7196125.1 FMN-binding protein [Streptococcus sp.]RTM04647.1 MAG: FMN-binding protein [Bradyrhizobiaceae bacterium]MBR1137055.1 FMN-binding protein [Bradyrhizobium denitrificans]MCL8487231.1 FMN-binding protein [Bradyrhizobium denitrificans]MDU1492661.1 FMN-binding protein [Bradyrhizobium sp.]
MSGWLKWTAPAAAVMSIAAPAYAMQYMSVEEAQKAAFPGASFAEVQAGRVWKASNGGYFYYDHVVGKHLLIDYTVAIGPDGKVRRVEILNYRESYGGEVHDPNWLGQFVGKGSQNELRINSDIRNISGATLSSTHLTEGVKKVLTYHASHFR